jgi:two-component system chemotaxis sensor kinase CheA
MFDPVPMPAVSPVAQPLSLAAAVPSIDGFLVGVGDASFVIPLEQVVECLELSAQQRRDASRRRLLELRGEVLPYASLRQIFAIDAADADSVSRSEIVVVVRSGGQRLGLAVDALHGEIASVVKPLNRVFQHVAGIGGSSILGNGQVALVLDLPGLLTYLAGATDIHKNAA